MLKWIIILVIAVIVFGALSKKKTAKTAATAQSAEVKNNDEIRVDPNFEKVCRLLRYTPDGMVCQVEYFFITKNFCCAVDSEGILYGATDLERNVPWGERFVMRPYEIGAIQTEDLSINDNGTDMISVRLIKRDTEQYYPVLIPADDLQKFSAAIEHAIESDEMLCEMMDGERRYGTFADQETVKHL